MEIVRKIFKGIYYFAIAIIIVIAGFLFLSVIPKSSLKALVVLSGSMEPKIHTGSVVAVKKQNDYKVGEVITFGENTKKKKPTTHRIMEVKENNGKKLYITKGDANNVPDQKPVAESEVLGKVFLTIPYAGYAVNAAQKPMGFMLIIVVPAVIIIYDEAHKIKKEILKKIDYRKRMKKRREDEENDNNKKDDEKEEKI